MARETARATGSWAGRHTHQINSTSTVTIPTMLSLIFQWENQKVCCKAGTLPAKPMPNACWRRISRIFSWNGNQQGPIAIAQSANFAFKIFMFKNSYFGGSWITCWDVVINTRLVSIMGHPVPGAQCRLANEMAPPPWAHIPMPKSRTMPPASLTRLAWKMLIGMTCKNAEKL